ncbi:MAG: HAMP domain-containing sensor histidine kinase [Clostridiales bacterium]|nr:HAMP domain-containing sensor histidine kinase [Clostridiales bacterium]
MKRKSILTRNYLATSLVFLAGIALFALAFSGLSYKHIIDDKRATISATAQVVANTSGAKSVDAELSDWDLRMTISTIAEASGTHISICDAEGLVCSCSDNDVFCAHIGSSVPLQAVSKLAADSDACLLTDMGGYYSGERYTACGTVKDPYTNEVIGYVLAAADIESITSMWQSFFGIFVIIAAIVITGVLVVYWFTVKEQLEPLKEMAAAAKAFGNGDMTVRVSGYGRTDEVGALSEAFNQMADSLESSEKQRKEFIANVSHELKTPMTTIAGYADGMLDGTIPWENRERYLMIISDETRRLSRLVRKMLDISAVQNKSEDAIKNSRCNLCETVRMAILSLESRINAKGLEIDAEIPDDEIVVKGEQDSITQISYNILDNAVKFAYPNSTISVKIWKQDVKVYVSIKNAGDDIPADELPYIFDRFHKSDKSRSMDKEGVGLGLYIVKSLINSFGEKIVAKSENNETEFVFSLTQAGE